MIRIIRLITIGFFAISLVAYAGISIYTEKSVDNTAPEIVMTESEIVVSTEEGSEVILEGITAEDDRDGDVTEYLVVEKMSNFISPGVREAAIAAFDKAGNVTRTVRTVEYEDYTSPKVALTEPLRVPLNNSAALLEKIQVTDCLDGDITENLQIVSDSSVSGLVAGIYTMHLQVSNSAGDSLDIPVTVEYYNSTETSASALELTDYLIYVEEGDEVDPLSYLKTLTIYTDVYEWDQNEEQFVYQGTAGAVEDDQEESDDDSYDHPSIGSEEIQIENPVDTSEPGTYEIEYSFQNYDNTRRTSVRLVVIVEEREE